MHYLTTQEKQLTFLITENNRLQIGFQNAKFFLEIQDWLFKLRNQIHERLFGLTTTSAPPLTIEILNLDKFELQNAIKNHGWHLLNLCK